MKTLQLTAAALFIFVGGYFYLTQYIYTEKQVIGADDYKNAEYVIDGARVQLADGYAESESAPGSASKVVTQFFGNEMVADLNDDGREDVVFLLTQERGGSGTFFYVVAALNTDEGYKGSDAFFLGDRIAPQTTEMSRNLAHKNVIVVNYADRVLDEPMTASPSVGKSVYLKLDSETMQFGVVEAEFEGEADPARMTLDMKVWRWVRTEFLNDDTVMPDEEGVFTVTFSDDGTFSATTDCNAMSGSYIAEEGILSFGPIAMTKKFCEGSQESEFAGFLEWVERFEFTSRGELIFVTEMGDNMVLR